MGNAHGASEDLLPSDQPVKGPLRRFVLGVEFLEGMEALLGALRVECELIEVEDVRFIRSEDSVDLPAAWSGLRIQTQQAFDGVHEVWRISSSDTIDGALETVLVDAVVPGLVVQFTTVLERGRFKEGQPHTKSFSDVAIHIGWVLSLLDELLHALFRS